MELLDARPLVDLDAALERNSPQPASEPGRLHRRGHGHERARAEHGRAGVRSDLVAGQGPPAVTPSDALAGIGRLAPGVILGRRRTHGDETLLRPPRVDPVRRAEL